MRENENIEEKISKLEDLIANEIYSMSDRQRKKELERKIVIVRFITHILF